MFMSLSDGKKIQVRVIYDWRRRGTHFGEKGPIGEYRTVTVRLSGEDGTVLAEGKAECSPLDQFVRIRGRRIAVARALKQLHIPSPDKGRIAAHVIGGRDPEASVRARAKEAAELALKALPAALRDEEMVAFLGQLEAIIFHCFRSVSRRRKKETSLSTERL